MKLIKPSQISGEILTLFDEADEKVIIVSPYCKMSKWYKLSKKLKSLIERNIAIEFYVREGEYETIQEVEQLGIEPISIKNLHCKIYLNEKEGIVSSMNLLLSSEMNSLDIAYKTTTEEEYDELINFYHRYIKQTHIEEINFDNNYLFETISKNFEQIRIYENENELALKTKRNNYSCFIWNVQKSQNKLRVSGILSQKEFENSKYLKSEIEDKINLEIEFIEGGRNGYGYNSVWATSKSLLKTESMNYIFEKEKKQITADIINFIKQIEQIKNSH